MMPVFFVVLSNNVGHYNYRYKILDGDYKFACIRTIKESIKKDEKIIFEGSPDSCREFLDGIIYSEVMKNECDKC